MNEHLSDTEPAYDIFVEEDRVTFVRRLEPTVESDLDVTVTSGLRFVPIMMLGAHGLIALLALALAAYLTLVPATAEVYALASGVPALAHVHRLPVIAITRSETVNTTGHTHVPATQARGLVTFYNSLTQPQVIDAGTLLLGADGEQVVTDQAASVPASNLPVMGSVSVWAHALSSGVEGNIRAGDIQGPCCRAFIQAVNAQFSGGRDAKDIQTVTRADRDTAVAGLLAQAQQAMQGRVASLLPPGDAALAPVPCSTHVASSKVVGAQARQITVTVTQDCQPQAYNVHDLQHALASLIAGKTPAQARTILLRQGMKEVGIRLDWLHDRLPVNSNQIHMVLVVH